MSTLDQNQNGAGDDEKGGAKALALVGADRRAAERTEVNVDLTLAPEYFKAGDEKSGVMAVEIAFDVQGKIRLFRAEPNGPVMCAGAKVIGVNEAAAAFLPVGEVIATMGQADSFERTAGGSSGILNAVRNIGAALGGAAFKMYQRDVLGEDPASTRGAAGLSRMWQEAERDAGAAFDAATLPALTAAGLPAEKIAEIRAASVKAAYDSRVAAEQAKQAAKDAKAGKAATEVAKAGGQALTVVSGGNGGRANGA
jgi:hypothetical protein